MDGGECIGISKQIDETMPASFSIPMYAVFLRMAVNAFSVFATPWEKIVMIIVIIVGLFAAHYLQFKATALFGIFARPWDLAHHLISKTQNNPEYKNEDNSEKKESNVENYLEEIGLIKPSKSSTKVLQS